MRLFHADGTTDNEDSEFMCHAGRSKEPKILHFVQDDTLK